MKRTPRKETDGSLALSFFLFKRNTHTHTHTHKHTKDVFQAVSVKIYGSPLRDEHMEQSSNFQLLLWSFSLSPTRILCVMWDCVSELAAALWTLGCGAELFSKLHFFENLEVRTVNMSLWAATLSGQRKAVRTAGEADNDCFHLRAGDLCAAPRPDTQVSSAKRNMHMYVIMLSCTEDFQLHRLHHAFQVV